MSAAVLSVKAERRAAGGMSPRAMARMAGVLYALEGTGSVIGGAYFRDKFIFAGNAAATASAMQTNETLFRVGFAAGLLAVAFHLAYTVLFYNLFRPVNRSIALLAASVSITACALQAFASLFQLAALLVVGGGSGLSGFTGQQTQDLALLLLNMNGQAFNIYLIFFGLWLIPTGYLIIRSTFFPRLIGVFLMLDGLGWVTYLWPPLATTIYPIIAIVAAFGELPLLVWLLVVGVNAQRWQEQAHIRAEASPRA
jgi:hypothetical protein